MIELQAVNRIFQVGDQQVHALDEVTLHIARGDYLTIMGPSGSGKSTLLNILGLLDRPDGGHYLLNGRDTVTLSDDEQADVRARHIGFVFQSFHLVARLTARENIELPMMLSGIDPTERVQRVDKALESVHLMERAHHRPDQLSGGQRQRVAIARATIMQPQVLLADEPTGNLDQSSGADVIQILEDLNQAGITLIVVTHDDQIGARATRHIRMVDGRIVGDNGKVSGPD